MIWHKIAETVAAIPWEENRMCIVEAGGKKITLGLVKEQVFAFAHQCPHAGGMMAGGYLNAACQVTCPLHGYRFDLKNGRNSSGEGYFLKTYPVEQRKEGVFVGF